VLVALDIHRVLYIGVAWCLSMWFASFCLYLLQLFGVEGSGVTSWRGAGFVGQGGFYGWWGFSRASKILLGDMVCSSFRWLFLENSA